MDVPLFSVRFGKHDFLNHFDPCFQLRISISPRCACARRHDSSSSLVCHHLYSSFALELSVVSCFHTQVTSIIHVHVYTTQYVDWTPQSARNCHFMTCFHTQFQWLELGLSKFQHEPPGLLYSRLVSSLSRGLDHCQHGWNHDLLYAWKPRWIVVVGAFVCPKH